MPSLNLLPENFKPKGGEKREESTTLVLASVFILLAGVVICAGIYFKKQSVLEELSAAELEVEKVEEKIEEEINKSETLLVESRAESIKNILLEHPYFSQAVKMVQGRLIEGTYLDGFGLTQGVKNKNDEDSSLPLKISIVARSYGIVIEQIAVWRNSFWIEEVSIGKISIDSEGKINLSVDMKVKEDIIFYHEPHWDYGLAFLNSKTNRHLKVNSYDAILKKTRAGGEDKVEINFSGIAYNEKALIMFRDNLSDDSSAENVFVSYDLNKKDNFERINFRGSAMVDYNNDTELKVHKVESL